MCDIIIFGNIFILNRNLLGIKLNRDTGMYSTIIYRLIRRYNMKVEAAQTALEVLREIISEQTDQPTSIRMYFAGAACSGPSFGLALDEKKSSDLSYNIEELEFIMDAQEYEQFGDMLIQDLGGGFRVIPEKMKDMQSSCGSCSGGCH